MKFSISERRFSASLALFSSRSPLAVCSCAFRSAASALFFSRATALSSSSEIRCLKVIFSLSVSTAKAIFCLTSMYIFLPTSLIFLFCSFDTLSNWFWRVVTISLALAVRSFCHSSRFNKGIGVLISLSSRDNVRLIRSLTVNGSFEPWKEKVISAKGTASSSSSGTLVTDRNSSIAS